MYLQSARKSLPPSLVRGLSFSLPISMLLVNTLRTKSANICFSMSCISRRYRHICYSTGIFLLCQDDLMLIQAMQYNRVNIESSIFISTINMVTWNSEVQAWWPRFMVRIISAQYFARINLPLFSTVVPAGTKVENKGKLILTEIFPSVQKHDIF